MSDTTNEGSVDSVTLNVLAPIGPVFNLESIESEIGKSRFPKSGYAKRQCRDCGQVASIHVSSTRCACCSGKHSRQRNAERQRTRRSLAAGRSEVATFGFLRVVQAVHFKCQNCGQDFTPKRSTAKFCCVRCRVYSSRQARQSQPTADNQTD